ncbi:MAG: tRNA preQ1(34) S-adenosylmethionine ribosyltransferase-isomerase QueA [Bacteriovorax sp. MedPE-SWde]|nr:MAG: tRNA preQ1(34) S-adenosylmethionine ribosyltransferase-isomerase QueA [Bacteriovorax sp. MedPE-SWde]
MQKSDFFLSSYDYDLPQELIASRPAEGRINSKLLIYNSKTDEVIHAHFYDLVKYLPHDALLVLNQSKVFPCRLNGKKPSGGKVEVFFLTATADNEGFYRVLIKSNGKKKIGDTYLFEGDLTVTISDIREGHFYVSVNITDLISYLDQYASIPIPPYIRGGESDDQDKLDYQTVFAKNIGSVAAPTAGLHFTQEIFDQLKNDCGIDRAQVTLHVGLGTFAPVKTDDIREHDMHSESYFVESDQWKKIIAAKKKIAVGTTSLRTLESIWQMGTDKLQTDSVYDTNIFLHPGVDIQSIDALITNFHLPKSTLLMLVSSLIGREKTLELYKIAVENEYRFFSYGDAMLILR